MATTTVDYFYVLNGSAHTQLKLFELQPGDVVTINWTMVVTTVFQSPFTDSGPALFFTTLPQYGPSPNYNFASHYSANSAIVNSSSQSISYIEHYLGTITFGAFTYTTELVDGHLNTDAQTGVWGPGDSIYLDLWNAWGYSGATNELTPDLLNIQITVSNVNRLTAPELPPRFSPAQKAQFSADADVLTQLAMVVSDLGASTDPLHPTAKLAGSIASQLAASLDARVGVVNSAVRAAVATVASALEESPGLNPIGVTLGIASAIDRTTAKLLRVLADDPPEGNYNSVYQAPDWSFGNIAGVSAAGNALVRTSWKLFQDAANALSASERYQGAVLAGDVSAQSGQSAAFNAAIDAYAADKQLASAALKAYLDEIRASIQDINLATDQSLQHLQAYLQGLASVTADPLLNDLITLIGNETPYLASTIQGDVQAAAAAVVALQEAPISGSAFALLGVLADNLGLVPLSVADALLRAAQNPAVSGLSIADSSAHVLSWLDSLAGIHTAVATIQFTDDSTPTLSLQAGQYLADLSVIEDITSAFNLAITFGNGITAITAPIDGRVGGNGGHHVILGLGLHEQVGFSGSSADFSVAKNLSSGVSVIPTGNLPGYQLNNVEFLSFADKVIFVESADNANIARLYSAALDRPPDIAGLSGWEDIYAANISAAAKAQGVYVALAQTDDGFGTSIAGGFAQSVEFQSRYGNLGDGEFITRLYLNVLDRVPGGDELNAWLDLLQNHGFSRDMALVGFAESLENIAKTSDWLIQV